MQKFSWLAFAAILTIVSCSQKNNSSDAQWQTAEKASALITEAPIADEKISAELSRQPGQKSFLNPQQSWNHGRALPFAAMGAPGGLEGAAQSGVREVQESDIYKIGPAGSKLLYLLNNTRGLQVVSFKDGADKAKLISRSPLRNSYINDMYAQDSKQRVIILASDYDSATQASSVSLATYDLTDPEKPKETQVLTVEGDLAASRIVGDVLYIASSMRNFNHNPFGGRNQQADKSYGVVTSVDLSKDELAVVQTVNLPNPMSWFWNSDMNVVQTTEDGKTKDYLLAVTEDVRGSWWNRNNIVEVVDISDPKGEIKHVLSAKVIGNINERSQVTIKDKHLVVVSNYRTAGAEPGAQGVMRYGVEVFALPAEGTQGIDQEEYSWRQSSISIGMKKWRADNPNADQDQEAAKLKELSENAEFGLKNIYVQQEESTALLKATPDFTETRGDTAGQSAQIRDVRIDGELLYIFWVPANLVDPLDVYDLKDVKAPRHLKRLLFEGWIERAHPVTYNNKKYIIGLGYQNEDVSTNPNPGAQPRRYPHVKLFEIKGTGENMKADDVAETKLKDSNTFANFNGEDKMLEFRINPDGKGEILFSVSKYTNNSYASGGQTINVDLSQVEAGGPVFTEGQFLQADGYFLRRVFTNPEIDAINTFTQHVLGTHPRGATGFAQTAHVLELARNIESYLTLASGSKQYGVQVVVSRNNGWNAGTNTDSVELRLTDEKKADAELTEVKSVIKVAGNPLGTYVSKDQTKIYVVTRTTKYENNVFSYADTVSEVALDGTKLKLVGSVELPQAVPEQAQADQAVTWKQIVSRTYGAESSLQPLSDTQYLYVDQARFAILTTSPQLSVKPLTLEMSAASFDLAKIAESSIKKLNGKYYWFLKVTTADATLNDVAYTRNYLAAIEIGAEKVTSGKWINIPGEPLQILKSKLLTKDEVLLDLRETKHPAQQGSPAHSTYETVSDTVLTVVELDANAAKLEDLYNGDEGQAIESYTQLTDGVLVNIEQSTGSRNWDGFGPGGGRGFFPGRRIQPRASSYDLVALRLGSQGVEKLSQGLSVGVLVEGAEVKSVLAETETDVKLLVGSYTEVQVLSVKKDISDATVVQIKPIDTNFAVTKKTDRIKVPGFYTYGGDNKTHYDAKRKAVTLSQGDYGVTQFLLAD